MNAPWWFWHSMQTRLTKWTASLLYRAQQESLRLEPIPRAGANLLNPKHHHHQVYLGDKKDDMDKMQ
jgi:hypothetical protein